jgi:2-C-methyl-D-erythritol 4-phosphate cytidylyltransferase/2-C-methyl-D-erythritol 2,4-cyclodiphosphate synthase
MKIITIIVAAGKGQRMKSDIPKQYLSLKGKTILYHSILPFLKHKKISDVFCVIAKNDIDLYNKSVANLNLPQPLFGGERRQDSVRFALEKIRYLSADLVLIHDAARPFISQKIIDDLIISLEKNKAVIPVITISDTVKKINNDIIFQTIPRDNLCLAQTPQGFNYKLIYDLHQKYQDQNFTDDAALCEIENIEVKAIKGDINNIKITKREDLIIK